MTFLERARLAKKQEVSGGSVMQSVESQKILESIVVENEKSRQESLERRTNQSGLERGSVMSSNRHSAEKINLNVPETMKIEDEPKDNLIKPAPSGGYQPSTGGYKPSAGGYQPSTGGYQPSAGGGYQPSSLNQPRRRRFGDDEPEEKPQQSVLNTRPRLAGPPAGDPFAKFDNYNPLGSASQNTAGQ